MVSNLTLVICKAAWQDLSPCTLCQNSVGCSINIKSEDIKNKCVGIKKCAIIRVKKIMNDLRGKKRWRKVKINSLYHDNAI